MLRFLAFLLLLAACHVLVPTGADARQVALVVGNARYASLDSLKNPKRDAAAIADRLRDLGFEVQEAFDADTFTLERAAERFVGAAQGADLALFYFAGHGIQLFDRSVMLASDANPQTADRIEALGLDLTRLIERLRVAGPLRSAILIDACRDNPMTFDETIALLRRVAPAGGVDPAEAVRSTRARGLASTALPQGGGGTGQTLMFFAAQPGNVSFDGDGQNSYFVEGLKEAFARADRPMSELLQQASAYVRTATDGRQVPQVVSDWTGDVVLGRTETAKVRYLNASARSGRELKDDEIRRVGEARRAIPALAGRFAAHESQSFIDAWIADEEADKRAKALGSVNGFAIDYDLDRDGRPETLAAYFRQTNVILALVKEGVTRLTTPCYAFDQDEVEAVEIALRDINGDRRPEIFLHLKTKNEQWGTFCILEFRGIRDVASSRRGPGGEQPDDDLFRILLRQTTATVGIGEDNTIETCDGSNCHTRSVIRFDGTHFRMTLDESDPPAPARARPFRDEEERRHIGGAKQVANAQPVAPPPPAVATTPRPATPVQPPPQQPPPPEAQVADFVVNGYLKDGNDGTITIRFADVVQYYGKTRRRDEVHADKRAYYARWTSRRYTLVAGTLTVTPAAQSDTYDVAFQYDFDLRRVAASGAVSQGRGRTRLTLRRDAAGGIVVTREEGEVVSRR